MSDKKFDVKYPEWTLGVSAKAVAEMGLRTDMLEDKPFWWFEDDGARLAFSEETPNSKLINRHLIIRQRNALETDESVLQILPYVMIGYPRQSGVADVTTYYRKKGHGEERLQGNRSFGWGGHPEVQDFIWTGEGDLDLRETILSCIGRELEQECIFTDTRTEEEVNVWGVIQYQDALKFCGFIYDTVDPNPGSGKVPVGRVHLAVVYFLALPDHIKVAKRENEHLDGPVMTLDELKAEIDGFEPWSRIIINDHYTRREEVRRHLEAHQEQQKDVEYHHLAAAAGQADVVDAPRTLLQEGVLKETLSDLQADAAAQ